MANSKIRGITIEIGGDTTKLGKALTNSEKQTRSLQTELKQIENLLKFDPTNTELLAQKQKVLADMISETSNKLDIMKEAEAQVIAQFERGDIGEDQLRAFQREVIQTENTLNDLKGELQIATRNLEEFGDNNGVAKEEQAKFEQATREAKEALEAEKKALEDAKQAQREHEKAVNDAKQELKDYGDKASEAFDKVKTGVLALGGATVAGGTYAVKLSTDFDKAFNTLQARTGATTEEMEGLNEIMEGIYKNNFGDSIEDVAVSLSTVKTNTKLAGDELQNMTERALLLRDTFNFDVNESTRTAKMLMDQFGISGEQAYNLIAQGAQAGLDKNGDLLDTINEYAVHYEQLGFSSEEFFNSLMNGAESGTFSVDKLGDAMKEFGIRTKDTATTTDEGFQLLGLDADLMRDKFAQGGASAREATQQTLDALFSMDDQVKQNQAGVDLFGTMWEDLGIEGVKALMDVTGEASLTSDALENITDVKYDDLGSDMQELGRTIQTDIVKPLGDDLKPVVEDVIDYVKDNGPTIKETISGVVDKVSELIGWVVDHGSEVLSTIAGIGAGFVAWNVATMINGVVGAIKAFKTANEGATIAQALLNGVMNANPAILIATIIATLVGAIITFIATNDEARAKIAEVWEAIKEAFGVAIDAIVGFFSSAWENIKAVWSVATGFFSDIWTGIVEVFSVVGEWFKNIFSKAWDGIKNIWSVVVTFFTTIWTGIKTVFSVVGEWFSDIFSRAWQGIKNIWNVATGFFSGIWTGIKNVFSAVATWFGGIFSKAWENIKNAFSKVTGFFSGIWDSIKKIFSNVGATIGDAITNTVKTAINGVLSTAVKIINGFIGAINTAVDVINAIPGVKINKLDKLSVPTLEYGGIAKKGQQYLLEGKGDEWVVPLEQHTAWSDNIAKRLYEYQNDLPSAQDSAVLSKLDDIYKRLDNFKQSIVLDSGVLVGETIDKIDQALAINYDLRARGGLT